MRQQTITINSAQISICSDTTNYRMWLTDGKYNTIDDKLTLHLPVIKTNATLYSPAMWELA